MCSFRGVNMCIFVTKPVTVCVVGVSMHVCAQECVCASLCAHVCNCVYAYARMCLYIYIYITIRVQLCVHVCVRARMCVECEYMHLETRVYEL